MSPEITVPSRSKLRAVDLELATEVFVRAVSLLKSGTYPYPATFRDGIWVMKDDPPRKKPRTAEVVAVNDDPARVISAITDQHVGWHFLSRIVGSEAEGKAVRGAYKQRGYRAHTTEWLFGHDLANLPILASTPPVVLVETEADLGRIPQRASHKRKLRPGTRLFCIYDEGQDHGWVRSVPVGSHAWVSDLYVRPESRGRGFGRALMSALLQSDRAHGVGSSVLLASSAGARLYPHLGYRQIGILYSFCPRSRP